MLIQKASNLNYDFIYKASFNKINFLIKFTLYIKRKDLNFIEIMFSQIKKITNKTKLHCYFYVIIN